MKRFLCLLLALLTVMLAAVSCDNSSVNNDVTSSDGVVTEAPTTEAETEAPVVIKEYDLTKFSIVYDTLTNMDIAKKVKQKFRQEMSIDLPIVRSNLSSVAEFEILIGNCDRDLSKACFNYKESKYLTSKGIVVDNGKIQLLGVDRITINSSIDYLFENVLTAGTKTVSLPEKGADAVEVTNESLSIPEKTGENTIRFVSNNILQQGLNNSATRITDLLGAFIRYDADILALQEVDSGWNTTQKLEERLGELGYALSPNEIQTDIYYKVDRFEFVDGGHVMYDLKGLPDTTARAYSWACLKDKQTGKKLIVTCTHFIANGSGASAQTISNRELHRQRCAELLVEAASTLMKKYGADGVVMAGDYNCNRTSKEYKIMAEGLNSARELAPSRVNMEYMTSCSVGKAPSKTADKAIDHIFYSKTGVVAKHFEAIITPMSYAYSDHVPVVFDFELN